MSSRIILEIPWELENWKTMKEAKRRFDCNEQMVIGSGSPQLCAKGSEGRIARKGVTERIKD